MTKLYIIAEIEAKRSILALLSSILGKNREINAQKQRVIAETEEKLPKVLFPRDIATKIFFEKSFAIALGNKRDWEDSTLKEYLRGSLFNGMQTYKNGIGAETLGPGTKQSEHLVSFAITYEVYAISRCVEIIEKEYQ